MYKAICGIVTLIGMATISQAPTRDMMSQSKIGDPEPQHTTPHTPPVLPAPHMTEGPAPANIDYTAVNQAINTIRPELERQQRAIDQLTDTVTKFIKTQAPPPPTRTPTCAEICPGPDSCNCACARALRTIQAQQAQQAQQIQQSQIRRRLTPKQAAQEGQVIGYDMTGRGWYSHSQELLDAHISKINDSLSPKP